MKKKITIFFKPIERYIEVPDNLEKEEIEHFIDNAVFDMWEYGGMGEPEISYWE